MTPRELLNSMPGSDWKAIPLGIRELLVALVEASERSVPVSFPARVRPPAPELPNYEFPETQPYPGKKEAI